MTRSISGREITLAAGPYTATVLTVGAALGSLTYRGADLVLRSPVDEFSDAFLGKTLLPWPNRIAGGRYPWNGTVHQLPVNDVEHGAALHGLVTWTEWQIADVQPDAVTLTTFVAPRPGYEWPLESTVVYSLDPSDGLTIRIETVNVGTETAPYGVSVHPYIRLGDRDVDALELTLPAARVYTTDARMTPVADGPVADAGLDFRAPRAVGATVLDHAFTGLPQGPWTIAVAEPASGIGVAITGDVGYAQVYTSDAMGRTALAVEPMSCAPDAFNSGDGLIALAPGERHRFACGLRALA